MDQKFVASYQPEANGRAERTVQKLTKVLRKVCANKQNQWHEYLHDVVWAINITVGELGYSPFRLVYGWDAVAPVELTIETYQTFVIKKSWMTKELLEFCALQMKNLVHELKEVQVNRDELKERWNTSIIDEITSRKRKSMNQVKKLLEKSNSTHGLEEEQEDGNLEDEGHSDLACVTEKMVLPISLVSPVSSVSPVSPVSSISPVSPVSPILIGVWQYQKGV
ncbi:hypothetical protein C2G38_2154772 [Gigaspora rosea]|uniref:Integrase catalytic domain-containing protein n=1 Tax=Gigaspora rosea TaxID=44941 RepID=A0A397W8L6_9GLOM|nr:hypothetical protein C2G38_2154772 [Gigaspora rosea]